MEPEPSRTRGRSVEDERVVNPAMAAIGGRGWMVKDAAVEMGTRKSIGKVVDVDVATILTCMVVRGGKEFAGISKLRCFKRAFQRVVVIGKPGVAEGSGVMVQTYENE